MAQGGSGRTVAGCSGCLVFIFVMLTAAFSLVPSFVPDLVPAAAWPYMAYGQYASSACCCLSGFLMVIGIVMLLMGGRSDDG